jgi:hypothetical protein
VGNGGYSITFATKKNSIGGGMSLQVSDKSLSLQSAAAAPMLNPLESRNHSGIHQLLSSPVDLFDRVIDHFQFSNSLRTSRGPQ